MLRSFSASQVIIMKTISLKHVYIKYEQIVYDTKLAISKYYNETGKLMMVGWFVGV